MGVRAATALVSVLDVAAATGLDVDTVRGHLERREWPGVRVGRRKCWRLPRGVIGELLAGRDPAALVQRGEAVPPGGRP